MFQVQYRWFKVTVDKDATPIENTIYSALQKYWNSEANSFIFAVDWKHLGLTSKDEYEMRDQHFSFYFQVFISGSDKQLRRYHLLFEPTHFSCEQKYWNMWLTGVFCCPGVSY